MASTFKIAQEGYNDPYTYRLCMVGDNTRLSIGVKSGGNKQFKFEDDNIWSSVIYDGNGKYVACGRTPSGLGCTSYSTDKCETWSETKIFGVSWYGITYGKGKYIVVGSEGYFATSTNEDTWDIFQIDNNVNFCDVAYGNDVFIAIGNTISRPVTCTSYVLKNGSDTWNKLDLNPSNFTIESITYSSSHNDFVAVGGSLSAVTSNGDYWSVNTLASGADLYGVVYDNRGIAVGNHEEIYYTDGGAGWNLVPFDSPMSIILLSVAYIPAMKAHLAVGTDGYSVAYTDANNRTTRTRFGMKDLNCIINVI